MIKLDSDKIRRDIIKEEFTEKEIRDIFLIEPKTMLKKYKDYLIELSDGYYYAKPVSEKALCNEIVGRYLCRKLFLQTTTLDILFNDLTLKMASPNYRKKDTIYAILDDFKSAHSRCFSIDKLFSLSNRYKDEQLKLISIDMMMEQTDRYDYNMEEVIEPNGKHLAPVIDFTMSFDFSNIYHNPYVTILKSPKSIDELLNMFPRAYNYFNSMFSIESEELINHIEEDYPIEVSRTIKETYQEITENNNLILK